MMAGEWAMRHARDSKLREREAVLISGLDLDGQATRSMIGGGLHMECLVESKMMS
jgi:hypothetical protein